MTATLLLFSILCFLAHCQTYKILIFVPGISHSHVQFDYRLANTIADKGHQVTIVLEEYSPLYHKMKLSPRVTEIKVDSTKGTLAKKGQALNQVTNEIFDVRGEFWEIIKNIKISSKLGNMMTLGCENLVSDTKLISRLKKDQYDLAIVDMYGYCPFGLIKLLEIPSYIWLCSSLLVNSISTMVGVPNPPSYVPHLLSPFGDRMSFGQRFVNFLALIGSQFVNRHFVIGKMNKIFRKHHGQDFPDLGHVATNSSLIFVNSEEFLDFPRPILHKVIYIGGLGLDKPQPLEPQWLKIVDESKEGVVLFSLGSVTNTTLMPEHWKDAFLSAFSKFPGVTFIWKFDSDLDKNKVPKNVILSNWVPQKDLFGHPKMKAFITHAGFNSLLEASTNGIPIIPIPLFADQFGNSKRAEKQGTAIPIQKWEINEKTVSKALEQILYNSSYKRNAQRLSNLIRKKPVKSSELVVKWIEYVAENQGLPNLEPASVHMNWIEYLSLDIVAVLLLIICLFLAAIYFVLKICINFVDFLAKSKKKVD